MDTQAHWERVYGTKSPTEVSWFRAHLETSLSLIERVAADRAVSIIDVGGGESTLVDDLIKGGYRNVTVLDISETAIEHTKNRLDSASGQVTWLTADITEARLPMYSYDVWHDRAVFHFLTERTQRLAYVRRVSSAVKPGGHVIVGAFGPEGPNKCSGLDVMRYDADSLHAEFGTRFRLVESTKELQLTPDVPPDLMGLRQITSWLHASSGFPLLPDVPRRWVSIRRIQGSRVPPDDRVHAWLSSSAPIQISAHM